MLVMSLSLLLGHAIPDIAKQPKSLFFLGGALVLAAPEYQNPEGKTTRPTRRGLPGGSWVVWWGALGGAWAALLSPLHGFLQLSPTQSAVFPSTCAMLTPRNVKLMLILMIFSNLFDHFGIT